MKRILLALLAIIALVSLAAACNVQQPTEQQKSQALTETYAQKLTKAEPYPLSAMNDSAERANLKERLLRMNNPNKVGYFYGLSSTGQVMMFVTIKGKVSSTGSQLTVTQNTVTGYQSITTVDSMGDDGSYGPEECQGQGVFFFTTQGVMGEWCGPWAYFDAPLQLASAPLMVMNADAKPSSTAGAVSP